MKITKRQLRRIIKEEKRKLLNESVADGMRFENSIDDVARQVSEMYYEQMGEELFDEDPSAFEGHSTKDEWLDQVHNASLDLETTLVDVIRKAIGENETRLHDGQYHRGNDHPFG